MIIHQTEYQIGCGYENVFMSVISGVMYKKELLFI